MPTLKTRLSLTALSLALLFSCAAPVVQPGQIKTAIDSAKVKALQEKIANDDTLLDALSADPKAFLAKEGVTLPADQQVKVLESGSKLYLILDDRSLQLLHPELNKAATPQNETAKKLAAIRAKAASDPAFKSELLKNTAQTLIKEGIPESIAAQFEVVDYQANVNVLMVASEGAEISRGTPQPGDWNLSIMKFNFGGKDYALPKPLYSLTKDVLNRWAKGVKFTNPTDSAQEKLIDKIMPDWEIPTGAACVYQSILFISSTFSESSFCTEFLRDGSVRSDFRNFLTSPNYLVSANTTQDTVIKIEQQYKFLRDAEAKISLLIQEEKDPKNKAKTLAHLQLMQTQANDLMSLIRTILPDDEGVALKPDPRVKDIKAGVEAILKTIKKLIAERQS